MVGARPPAVFVREKGVRMLPVAGIGIALALLTVPAFQDATVHVVWNASPSVPLGLYGIIHRRPDMGELALVRLPEAIAQLADQHGYLPRSALLIKPVAATAGDHVCRFGAEIFVRGDLLARTVTESAPLSVWQGCRTLEGGELFLLADHPASFDSRYFGPLHARHVVGTAILLWRIQ